MFDDAVNLTRCAVYVDDVAKSNRVAVSERIVDFTVIVGVRASVETMRRRNGPATVQHARRATTRRDKNDPAVLCVDGRKLIPSNNGLFGSTRHVFGRVSVTAYLSTSESTQRK
jgi:hypothetical protein